MKKLTAILCLTTAVLLGSTGGGWGADFQKGGAAYLSGDYATALREIKPLAEKGYDLAQLVLSMMYDSGKGVPKEDKEAVKWYRLAAEQWNAEAQSNLGGIYGNGAGVIQDYVRAHMWWNIAASSGEG